MRGVAMVRKLEIDLDEATHARLVQEAARTGQTPEEYLLQRGLNELNAAAAKTVKLSDFFGIAKGGIVRGVDEASIREDLSNESDGKAGKS